VETVDFYRLGFLRDPITVFHGTDGGFSPPSSLHSVESISAQTAEKFGRSGSVIPPTNGVRQFFPGSDFNWSGLCTRGPRSLARWLDDCAGRPPHTIYLNPIQDPETIIAGRDNAGTRFRRSTGVPGDSISAWQKN
jgi:hypothetical protein